MSRACNGGSDGYDCENQDGEEYYLEDMKTTTLTIVQLTPCSYSAVRMGLREAEVWGQQIYTKIP